MRLLLAIIFPPLVFFTINRPLQGLMNAFLWLTFIGWPVAAIWAVYALSQYRNDELRREFDYDRRYSRY
jgi:Mn2+/Fe2+ NRAMP family transporter